jgi:putative redox protein
MNYKMQEPVHGYIGQEKYRMTIKWRNGEFIADEPATNGGQDTGPDPFTLLLASLASCTLATLRMYIDRKGWTIPEIEVNTNLFQNVKDEVLRTTIDRDIRFPGGVTDEQRTKLLAIAAACPISKLLEGNISVRTYAYSDGANAKTLHYTNGAVTVFWKPDLCKHSGRCVFGLPSVFNVSKHPWINMQGASTEEIVQQVNQCPTGALSFQMNDAANKNTPS